MDPTFQFTITYDEESARAAARLITMRMWGGLLKVTAVLTPLAVVAVIWLARVAGATWFYWMLLPLAVGHAGQAWLIWRQSRRWMKMFVGSARVTLSENDFGIASERGSHVVPWSLFKASHRDSRNVFLFLSKTAAVVIPTKGLSAAAVEFMIDHVLSNKGGREPAVPAA